MTYNDVSTMCYLGYKNSIAWTNEKIKSYFKKTEKSFSCFIGKFRRKWRQREKKRVRSGGKFSSKAGCSVVDKRSKIG